MKIPVTRASLLLREAVQEVVSHGAMPASVLDHVDEVAWLYDLCVRQANPERYRPPVWEPPVYRHPDGKLTLQVLSWGAIRWLKERVATWCRPGDEEELLADAFAMAHADRPEVFEPLYTEREARKAIDAWVHTVPLSPRALKKIVTDYCDRGVVIDVPSPNEPQRSPLSDGEALEYGPLLARMAWAYKIHPRDLLWKLSDDQFEALLKNMPAADGSLPEERSSSRDAEMMRLVVQIIVQSRNNDLPTEHTEHAETQEPKVKP